MALSPVHTSGELSTLTSSSLACHSLHAGGGARKCIGDQFAITEATLALVMILRRFRFRLKDPKAVSAGGGHLAVPNKQTCLGTLYPNLGSTGGSATSLKFNI
jgi:hypothetical protein